MKPGRAVTRARGGERESEGGRSVGLAGRARGERAAAAKHAGRGNGKAMLSASVGQFPSGEREREREREVPEGRSGPGGGCGALGPQPWTRATR